MRDGAAGQNYLSCKSEHFYSRLLLFGGVLINVAHYFHKN